MTNRTEIHRVQCDTYVWEGCWESDPERTLSYAEFRTCCEFGHKRFVVDGGTLRRFGIQPDLASWYLLTVEIDEEAPTIGVIDCISDDEAIEVPYRVDSARRALPG